MTGSISHKVLTCLSNVGFIPTSVCMLKIFCLLAVPFLSCTAFVLVLDHFYLSVSTNFANEIMNVVSDLTFALTGILCPLVNYSLHKRFPDTLPHQELKPPRRIILLLVTFAINFGTLLTYMITESYKIVDKKADKWQISLTMTIIGPVAMIYTQISLFSYLYLFGCIVTIYQAKTVEATGTCCVNVSEFIAYHKQVLMNYKLFKKSVSPGLFIIFTLQTISAILMVYVTIKISSGPFEIFVSSFCWSSGVCLILIYTALVSDDVEQSRQEWIDHLM